MRFRATEARAKGRKWKQHDGVLTPTMGDAGYSVLQYLVSELSALAAITSPLGAKMPTAAEASNTRISPDAMCLSVPAASTQLPSGEKRGKRPTSGAQLKPSMAFS